MSGRRPGEPFSDLTEVSIAGLPLALGRVKGSQMMVAEAILSLDSVADVLERVACGLVAPRDGFGAAAEAIRAEVARLRRMLEALQPAEEAIRARLVS